MDGEIQRQTPTATTSEPYTWPSSTGVKERPQSAMKLPLDQTDYLQPQSSLPATYLDLVATPGKHHVHTSHLTCDNDVFWARVVGGCVVSMNVQ